MSSQSPTITELSWGEIATSAGTFRDAKLWPGGGRNWDWNETGTSHSPGIQPADVREVLDQGAEIVVLGRGQRRRLQVMDVTIATVEDAGASAEVLESNAAVDRYNELVHAGEPVGALIHTTC